MTDHKSAYKARLLDLFCGAGGCSVGYARAGFDVTGVDIEGHPDYPFELHVEDALTFMARADLSSFDAIHASPPCQALTTMANRYRGKGGPTDDHVNLIAPVREALEATGLPYVIENVAGAKLHLRAPVTLSGGAFGLRVYRPRLFETNFALTAPPRVRVHDPLGIYGKLDGRRIWTRKDGTIQRGARTLAEGAAAMGIDWMTAWEDVTEAIPPAYTEWIGAQLLDHLAAVSASTLDTWAGRKARITPSGHIHHIEAVSHRDSFDRDVAITVCGKETRRAHLTLFFPPEGRHCPRCFPSSMAFR